MLTQALVKHLHNFVSVAVRTLLIVAVFCENDFGKIMNTREACQREYPQSGICKSFYRLGSVSEHSSTLAKRRFFSSSALILYVMAFLLCAALQSKAGMPPDDFISLCASAGPDAVRDALDKGADPHVLWTGPNQISKTRPLIYQGDSALAACLRNRADIETARMLLDAGVNPDPWSRGKSPLRIAVSRGRADLVDLLLRAGADPKTSDLLAHDAAVGDPEVFTLVMRAGADLRSTDQDGKTVLHYAARNERADPVLALLAAGFDPNVEDREGNSPLHERLRSAEVVASLAKAGADVNRENKKGLAPFEEVREQAIMDAFLDAGALLTWLDAHGRTHVRGFSPDGRKGAGHIRFFEAVTTVDHASIGRMTPVQKAVLASVTLEKTRRAEPDGAEKYSEMVCFVSRYDGTPIANYEYYIESRKGAAAFGRSGKDGCTARLYSPGPEELTWNSGEDAVVSQNELTVSGRANVLFEPAGVLGETLTASPEPEDVGRSERACFAHPDDRLPAAGYPYFILTESGYAIAGETGEDGCSADFFAPVGDIEAFAVYGGPDATRMNVKGQLPI
jgi:hypothetical protein